MDRLSLRGRWLPSVFFWSLVAIAGLAVASPVLATDLYVDSSASVAGACTQAEPCTTIAEAIAEANQGDTIHIASGIYANSGAPLTVSVDGLTLLGEGATPPELTNTTGSSNHPLLVIQARGVHVEGLQFDMDQSFVAEGILASGNVDGLSIASNRFVQSRSDSGQNSKYSWRNAISINDVSNSLGLGRGNGSNVSITDNVIDGLADAANGVFLRCGIDMDAGVGNLGNNTISAGIHDIRVRFSTVTGQSSGATTTIDGNTLNGRGLELDSPNASAGPITISNNHINAIAGIDDGTPYAADWSIMRLIGNEQGVAVNVTGNTFAGYQGHYRGVLVENFPATTFTGNTFTPAAGANDFVSLVISNKALTSDVPAAAPLPMSFDAQGNIFNGSGVDGAGTAVEFLNDNDAGATFGSLGFGGLGANDANHFDGQLQYYFYLDDHDCETVGAPTCTFLDYAGDIGSDAGTNTSVRPFSGDVQASHNRYAGVAPADMDVPQVQALAARTFDNADHADLGSVVYDLPTPPTVVYVDDDYVGATPGDVETFTHPQVNGGSSISVTFGQNAFATITEGLAHVADGGSVYVAKGVYAETDGDGDNLAIYRPVHIIGAQAGVDARTRNMADAEETIVVPADAEPGLSLDPINLSAVVYIASSDVTMDGLVVDADNHALTSGVDLNGTDPDVSGGIYVIGGGDTVLENMILRNMIYTGIDGWVNSGSSGGNIIHHDRFTNITAPSTWGRGVILESNFYAQVTDNLMDEVRVGVQTNNNHGPAPAGFTPEISNNEIHATRTGIFHNEFYNTASTYTIANNHILAAAHAGETTEWSGLWVQTMQAAQTVIISGNVIDGSAVTGTQPSVGYLLDNIVSSASATTVIDGGSVRGVDAGVQATDATYYTGPVDDMLVQNVAFSDIGIGAFYVEDTNEQTGSAKLTIGDGNTYTNVAHVLALSGSAPQVGFAGSQTSVPSVFVRAAGGYFNDPVAAGYTVANASINTGIGYTSNGGKVAVEAGTFDEAVVVNKSITLEGPQHGVAGFDAARGGSDEAVISPSGPTVNKGAAIKVLADNASVDGLTVDNVNNPAILSGGNFGGATSGVRIINNRLLHIHSGTALYTNGPYPAATDWTISHNLVSHVDSAVGSGINYWAASGGVVSDNHVDTIGFAGIQVVNSSNVLVSDNTIDHTVHSGINVGTAGSQYSADGNIIRGNSISNANTGAEADGGGLKLSSGASHTTFVCNAVGGGGTNGFATGASSTTGIPDFNGAKVFDNVLTVTSGISHNQASDINIGSNWYGGAAASVVGSNAAGVRVADALPVSPIGKPACGDNTATQIVAYDGGNQLAAINAGFAAPLQARVLDALGGAVADQPVMFAAPTSGASATFGGASGSTDYNGVFASTATANGMAGTYQVSAADTADGGISPASFTLTNDVATATISLNAADLDAVYDGNAHAVNATTNPSGLSYSVTYDGNSTPPVNVGTYAVVATITAPNYSPASASGVLHITPAAQTDLAVTITDNRDYAQYDHVLSYVIVVTNSGNQDVVAANVSDVLPVTLLPQQPVSWHCYPAANASCASTSGSGDLNTSVDIQAGGSVTFVLDTLVNGAPNLPAEQLLNTVTVAASGDTNSGNNSATDATQAVIFRDGFEPYGDGAQVPLFVSGMQPASIGSTTAGALTIPLSTPMPNRTVTPLAVGSDAQGEAFRVQALRIDGTLRVRMLTRDGNGEQASNWVAVKAGTAALGLGLVKAADGSTHALLVGADATLEMTVPDALVSVHAVKPRPGKD